MSQVSLKTVEICVAWEKQSLVGRSLGSLSSAWEAVGAVAYIEGGAVVSKLIKKRYSFNFLIFTVVTLP